MTSKIYDYFNLTKPSIMLLVVLTGATSLILEGSLLHNPIKIFGILLALFLTGGSANALNQYFERDIDAKMKRTAKRRPLPQHRIESRRALIFSILIGIAGVLIFAVFYNLYSAVLALLTILFYSLFYTLVLKPNTPQNIVIGGAAGAMAPVGAWVAASGTMDIVSWILFLIIFFWTPPHFWALALFYKDDYKASQLPMMPVVKGDASTLIQINIYTWILVVASLLLLVSGKIGWIYLTAAVIFGIFFIIKSYLAKKAMTEIIYRRLFGYSISYLFLLFGAIIIDGLI